MTDCGWRIRWTFNQDADCALDEHLPGDKTHQALITGFSRDGTILNWTAGDRREFRGEWPGPCEKLAGCTLHTGHHGRCAP